VFISRLGQIPEVRVLPLSATARLAPGDDFESRARDLGATHVLSGTLQRDGHRVRATVRFVSTSDSRTVWSTPVDADSTSVFTVQDIIVTRVIEKLAPGLEASARRRLAHPGTRNSDAFDAYLRGRAFVLRPTRTELTRAADAFRTAVRLDPSFADAWAGLATACKRLPLFDVPPVEGFTEAKRAADRALELQVDHPEALAALAAVAFWFEWNYPRAEQLLKRALELQPSSADSLVMLGHLFSNIGRHDEALAEIRRARALDPSWSVPRSLESQFLFMARRYDDALARATEIVTLDPQFTAGRIMRIYPLLALGRNQEAHREGDEVLRLQQQLGAARPVSFVLMLQGYAMARMGRRSEAERLLERMRAQALQQYVPPHHEALLLHALGRHDEAIDRLRAGVDGRDLFVTFVAVDSKWDGLRDSPSFRALLARVNLLDVSDRARR
jgi:tetratricopeptide (TPR) repeat protein